MSDPDKTLTVMLVREGRKIRSIEVNLERVKSWCTRSMVLGLMIVTAVMSGWSSNMVDRFDTLAMIAPPAVEQAALAPADAGADPLAAAMPAPPAEQPEHSVLAVEQRQEVPAIQRVDLLQDAGLLLSNITVLEHGPTGQTTVQYRISNLTNAGPVSGYVTIIPEYMLGRHSEFRSFPADNAAVDGNPLSFAAGDSFKIRFFKDVICHINPGAGHLTRVWFHVHANDGTVVYRDCVQVGDEEPEGEGKDNPSLAALTHASAGAPYQPERLP